MKGEVLLIEELEVFGQREYILPHGDLDEGDAEANTAQLQFRYQVAVQHKAIESRVGLALFGVHFGQVFRFSMVPRNSAAVDKKRIKACFDEFGNLGIEIWLQADIGVGENEVICIRVFIGKLPNIRDEGEGRLVLEAGQVAHRAGEWRQGTESFRHGGLILGKMRRAQFHLQAGFNCLLVSRLHACPGECLHPRPFAAFGSRKWIDDMGDAGHGAKIKNFPQARFFVDLFMHETVFEGGTEPLGKYLGRVWKARRLILTLAWRDVRITYAQTFLGILWAAIQPLTGLFIFTIFFSWMLKMDTGTIPYPLFAFVGLMSWYLFSALLRNSGTALIQSQDLIRNLNFPRLILPLSKAFSSLPEFGISLVILLVMMLVLGHLPQWQIIFLPVFLLLNVLTALSIGIWLSALTLRYRDFQHIIPYILNFGIWLTPVFYPTTLIPEKYSYVLYFNPMAGIVQGFRWCLVGGEMPSVLFGFSFLAVALLFFSGILYFRRVERLVVDLV